MWNSLFGSPYTLESSVYELPFASRSPTPSADRVPTLPPELIVVIQQASLAAPSYDGFSTRSATLRSYSLVSRTWRPVAQHELFEHVVLATGGRQAEQLVRSLQARQADNLAGRVRSIRLGGGGLKVLGTGLMAPLLEAGAGVEELWIAGWANFDLAWLRTNKRLRRIYISEARIVSTLSHQFLLDSLDHLYLKGVILVGDACSTLLSPASLPALRSLAFLSVHFSPTPTHSLIAPLAPQLTSVAIGDYHARTLSLSGDLSTASQLTTLDIPYTSLFPPPDGVHSDSICLIPPSTKHLRLRGTIPTPHEALLPFTIRAVVSALALTHLSSLSFLDQEHWDHQEVREAMQALDPAIEIVPRERWDCDTDAGFRRDFDLFRRAAVGE